MPSPTYELFVEALIGEKGIRCLYGGHLREIDPIILGLNSRGEEAALVYQHGGTSSSRVPDWKCLSIAKIRAAHLTGKPLGTRPSTSGNNVCVAVVDLDVNPDSPYKPKRLLSDLRSKALLAAAPLEGVDLIREQDLGRPIDL